LRTGEYPELELPVTSDHVKVIEVLDEEFPAKFNGAMTGGV
jgi:hypothetical protein